MTREVDPDSPPAAGDGPLVLVVDDEPQIRRYLRTALPVNGWRVREAADGAAALRDAATSPPDLVLLDLGLPDLDGLEVVRRLREWFTGPILVVSAREAEKQKVEALDAGADDYLVKPFAFGELTARMRACLRRAVEPAGAAAAGVFQTGPLRIDYGARRASVDGTEVKLTPIEYKLLCVLAKYAGRIVTQKQLLTAVWGPHAQSRGHYLRVYMTHLRRKLGPDPSRPGLFETEPGVGYRLVADGGD